jgi:hypothetical protein
MFLLKRNGSFQNIIYRKKQEVQQNKWMKRLNNIVDELKEEGEW